MSDGPRYSVSVAGIVIREDGKVLCIQRRDNGHWEPPGGVLELGERIHDGLIREVREETGLTVEPGPLTGVYQNEVRDIIALVFRCTVTGGALVTSDETMAVDWLSHDAIEDRFSETYAVRVFDALNSLSPVALRVHDGRKVTT